MPPPPGVFLFKVLAVCFPLLDSVLFTTVFLVQKTAEHSTCWVNTLTSCQIRMSFLFTSCGSHSGSQDAPFHLARLIPVQWIVWGLTPYPFPGHWVHFFYSWCSIHCQFTWTSLRCLGKNVYIVFYWRPGLGHCWLVNEALFNLKCFLFRVSQVLLLFFSNSWNYMTCITCVLYMWQLFYK